VVKSRGTERGKCRYLGGRREARGARRMMDRLLLESSAAGALSRTIETTESKK
jgi:hypothetical protein